LKTTFLDLGRQPIANRFLREEDFDNEFFYDLTATFDDVTGLVSLGKFVAPEEMFNENYAYHTSNSLSMVKHFKRVSDDLKKLNPISVLEIGSNDGAFSRNFNNHMCTLVEPCMNFAQETRDAGYTTYPYFWNTELADDILNKRGNMDLVYAANCICHIQDLDNCFSAVKRILSRDGTFVFEDPSLLSMIQLGSYDQIYDEHAHIFSLYALDNLLRKCGLQIVDVVKLTTHGGSNRIFVKHIDGDNSNKIDYFIKEETDAGLNNLDTYLNFEKRVEKSKKSLLNFFSIIEDPIVSIGATSKSTTVFNYCRLDPGHIECITDTTTEKQGLHSPGCHIPVVARDSINLNKYNYAYLGAWNFKDEIVYNERTGNGYEGDFITHIPQVEIF